MLPFTASVPPSTGVSLRPGEERRVGRDKAGGGVNMGGKGISVTLSNKDKF